MSPFSRVLDCLVARWQWPYAALFAGCLLVVLLPAWYAVAGLALTAIYLHVPLYMLHQFEEHAGDRFRRSVNEMLGGGREVLTPNATFLINSLGVWGIDLLALYLAIWIRPALGLMAIYMVLINGTAHTIQALVRRAYNPGLVTSLVLFLPAGAWTWFVIQATGATALDHVIGFGVALVVHAAIIGHVVRRVKSLKRGENGAAAPLGHQTLAHG